MKSSRPDDIGDLLTIWGWLWLIVTVLIEFAFIGIAVELGLGDGRIIVPFVAGSAICVFVAGSWLLERVGIQCFK